MLEYLIRGADSEAVDLRKKMEGMVETGEGRTPRPEDSPTRMYYRLSR